MGRSPLVETKIVEWNAPQCPPAVRRATAIAGRIAADLGATVVRIVDEADAEFWRSPSSHGDSGHAFLHAGKRLVAGDDAAAEIGEADGILTDTLAAGRVEKMGASAAVAIVGMEGSGSGTAPMTEFTAMATVGLLDMVGDPDREPLRFGGHQLAYAAGLAAYTGLMTLLCAPPGEGRGTVQVNLVDVGVWLNWKSVLTAQVQGWAPTRMGRQAEWQVLQCADGWVAFVYRDWDALRAAVTDARLGDPRFATRIGRRKHSDEIADIVEETFRGLTRREIGELAQQHRIPLGPIWTSEEILGDRQYLAREFFHAVPNGGGGTTPIPRAPVVWNGRAMKPGAVPSLPEAVKA